VLTFTTAKMIVGEPLLDGVFDQSAPARWALYAIAIGGVLTAGWLPSRRAAGSA
jgi:hypothetical protein